MRLLYHERIRAIRNGQKLCFQIRLQFLLANTVVFKTSLKHLANDTILTLLNSGITIIQKLCFGVAFCTITKGHVTFIIKRQTNRKLLMKSKCRRTTIRK